MAYARAIWLVTLLLLAFCMAPATAGPKPSDQAFRFGIALGEELGLELSWSIEPGYYLYRGRIAARLGDRPLKVTTRRGETKDDQTFGSTEIYRDQATAYVDEAMPETGEILVTYQGCGENTICYPPITKLIDLATLTVRDAGEQAHGAHPQSMAVESALTAADAESAGPDLGGSLASTLLAFLGFGVLLAFTPCVFPMLPILAGMLSRSGSELSMGRGFLLSATYVFAMAAAYGLLGVFAAWFGGNLQIYLQTPIAIALMSLAFAMLALSMFGLYELQVPLSLATRLMPSADRAGSLGGAAALGLASALIVGPCVTPPLAAALIYIGQTGDTLRGSAALSALGLGMGLPLLALGTLGARALPKSGPWLVRVKQAFGIAFLGIAVWMMSRILPVSLIAVAWGALFVGMAIWAGEQAFGQTRFVPRWWRVASASTALALLIYGALLTIGGLAGWYAPLQPLAWAGIARTIDGSNLASQDFQVVTNEADLDAALAAGDADGRAVMIDFSAEWCTECRLMERTVLADATVRQRLGRLRLIRVDKTRYDTLSKELMERFAVIGPPTLIFLNAAGKEVSGTRIVGMTAVDDVLSKVAAAERG